jgi:hypothetical protein
MARKRTMNYRDFRTDYAEGEEQKREDVEEEDEDEEEDEEEEGSEEEEEGGGEEDEEEASDEDEDEEGAPKKKKKAPPKKKEPKPKPVRAKKPRASKIVRMRVVWGVFDNSNKRIEVYDYNKKSDAEEHATRLQTEKKQTFFIQPVKIPFVEEEK